MRAESRLYARRVKGDLDLGLEPARIDSQGNQHWADIVAPGGLLPGGVFQDIHTQSVNQNYRIGTRRLMDDRAFRYCRASTGVGAQYGVFTDRQAIYEGDGAQPVVAVGITDFNFTTAEAIAVHALADGWFVGYGERGFYLISDNDLAAGGLCHIYLKRPIWNQIGGGATRFYCYPNIYRNIRTSGGVNINDCYATVVAVSLINVTSGRYFWGQTWGPCPLICGLWGNLIGQTTNQREFHFDYTGSIVYRPGAEAVDAHMQRGGYLLFDGREATGGDQMVFLQLAP